MPDRAANPVSRAPHLGTPEKIRFSLDAGAQELDTCLTDTFWQPARNWALPGNQFFSRLYSNFQFSRQNRQLRAFSVKSKCGLNWNCGGDGICENVEKNGARGGSRT